MELSAVHFGEVFSPLQNTTIKLLLTIFNRLEVNRTQYHFTRLRRTRSC